MMKKLLSLPPNLVNCFHEITGLSRDEWFCTNDPVGKKLGSGGGTTWLLNEFEKTEAKGEMAEASETSEASRAPQFRCGERKILLHAGGQSRRLPSYAPSGKILTPIPVFRWERGQKLSQDLLSLQIPLYERIMEMAPKTLNTMIVSGDVYIRATKPLQEIPNVDVVCYGLWLGPEIAKDHGVFVMKRETPNVLDCMLQKPSVQTLGGLLKDHFYLTDIGVWLLSDRAVELLKRKSMKDGEVVNYDLYSDFGPALGTNPTVKDDELKDLTVAILPLPGGEFYHFGTSREIISSTLAIQNLTNDQQEILHHSLKPHPSMFIQNSGLEIKVKEENQNLWIENSFIGKNWKLSHDHIITGVPENDWEIDLQPGQCVDIIPVGEDEFVVRPYMMDDKFAGELQSTPMFPTCPTIEGAGKILKAMLAQLSDAKSTTLSTYSRISKLLENYRLLSAEQISNEANLVRLTAQRKAFRKDNWPLIAKNHEHSVFYQTDLEDAAQEFAKHGIPLPEELGESSPLLKRIHDAMFRSEVLSKSSEISGARDSKSPERPVLGNSVAESSENYAARAFSLLREGVLGIDSATSLSSPRLSVFSDQIVWGRSPVRIDIAGGWTDTPPYCLMEGGTVVNLAIELNGQQPLQTYVKPCKEPHIVLRSIDLGAEERVETFEQLADFNHVGSPFSIPKAALALAGFLPRHSVEKFPSLKEQLQAFGCGIEVTLLSAIPAGSGLGTSSMLAATVLGTLNDFCGLHWDKNEIGLRTLILEQYLTTGGGWQDQFGGILQGVKLLQTERGFNQSPKTFWLPTDVFTQPEYQPCHLLYYTGITRTAKTILAEIVRRMFLNQGDELALLRQMKQHAQDMYEAIQCVDFEKTGRLVRKTWRQNQAIDSGTNPVAVQQITSMIDDLCLGYKLAGAGGGGYLYMMAKDPQAATRIKQILQQNAPNSRARFVDMRLSQTGLAVSRS